MDKIVGKLWKYLFCILLFTTSLEASLKLRAVDMEGQELEQAEVGLPFMLEVSITDLGKNLPEPEINGDSNIVIHRTGLFISTINGISTTKYSYKVRIDHVGIFQLGPARVIHQGMPIESNILTIKVADQQKSKNDKQTNDAFLELYVDKDQAVVGQKINCSLTFYYTGDRIALKQVGQPDIHGFSKKVKDQKPTLGTETKNGTLYQYVRWQWELYPKISGKLTIPAHRADYEIQSKQNQRFNRFGFFFGNQFQDKRVYSNAEQIHVDPLPEYNGNVDAVGNFKYMHASIKPAVAKKGEAMVLTLEIGGEGDLQSIQPIKLKHMPDQGLRSYESKNYIVEPKNIYDKPKKCFEYIIQGLKEGDWQIPKQTFTYFDVDSYKYKTLETVPLMVKILPGISQDNQEQFIENEQEDLQEEKDTVAEQEQDNPLVNEVDKWHSVQERKPMPFWLFLFLMSFPIILILFKKIYKSIQHYNQLHSPNWRAKRAFKRAYKQLKNAQKNNNVAQIYYIIIQLFADKLHTSRELITQDFMEHTLKKKGLSSNQINQFQHFLTSTTASVFSDIKQMDNNLFDQAKEWIKYLQEVL